MIQIENLNKYYGQGTQKLHVLKSLNLHIHSGELVSIMGSSGSGKSTLLNILLENVALPLIYQKVSRKTRNKRAEEELEKVGLKDRLTHLPGELSGGQKQRVALARALVTDPKVILADEPTGALDSKTTSEVMTLFKDIHSQGKTVVIVTHEDEIAHQTERTIYLKDGSIVDTH